MKPLQFLLFTPVIGLSNLAFETEDWTFLAQGKLINAHINLQRTK